MINNFNLKKCPLCSSDVEANVTLTWLPQIRIECPKCHLTLEEYLLPRLIEDLQNKSVVACYTPCPPKTISAEDLVQQISAVVNKWNNR